MATPFLMATKPLRLTQMREELLDEVLDGNQTILMTLVMSSGEVALSCANVFAKRGSGLRDPKT